MKIHIIGGPGSGKTFLADKLSRLGFTLYATGGTALRLNKNMIPTNMVRKIHEGHPHIIDLIESGKIDYMISTSKKGRIPQRDSVKVRRKAVERSIPCLTAIDTAAVLVDCLMMNKKVEEIDVVDITKI